MTETKQTELPEDQLDVVHELILRGLRETDPTEHEYARAYDAFVDAAGYAGRIGDQPDRVRDAWNEIIEAEPRNPRPEEYDERATRLEAMSKNIEWLRKHDLDDQGYEAAKRLGLIKGDVQALIHSLDEDAENR